jgi:transposase
LQAGARRRHPKKDLEKVLQEAEQHGWRVVETKKYFKLLCSCADKHKRWVHLSPSDGDYAKNLLAWLGRQSCWRESE